MVGQLNKAMYGLRDAPQVWQQEVRRILSGMGFYESKTSPCVYYNPLTEVRLVTHVDDFLCTGPGEQLRIFYDELHDVLDLKCEVLGPDSCDSKTGSFLGRTIQWNHWGISWCGDSKILEEMLVEWDMDGGGTVQSPYVKDDGDNASKGDTVIQDQARATRFR